MKCKVCNSSDLSDLLFRKNMPIFQNIKCRTKQDALSLRCENLDIKICNICGAAHNSAFKNEAVCYGESYENSQFHSNKYMDYINKIIDLLINKYNISNTNIAEIGCGNGRFLSILANKSNSKGFGFDPAYNGENMLMGGGIRDKERILQPTKSPKLRFDCL